MADSNLKARWEKFKTIGVTRRARGEEDELKEGNFFTFILVTLFSIGAGAITAALLVLYLFHFLAHHWFVPDFGKSSDADDVANIKNLLVNSMFIGAALGLAGGWALWFTNPKETTPSEDDKAEKRRAEQDRFDRMHGYRK